MTAAVKMRTFLQGTIGLGMTNEGLERADTIMDEGLDAFAVFHELCNDEMVSTLCNNVRKPAGTIPQPGWVAIPRRPRTAPMIPRPGKSIPVICE